MHPRLSPSGAPVGQRKKARKEKTKKSRKLPPPHPFYHCTCFDCVESPGCHPETGLPCYGQWITKRELESHSSAQRNRGVANSLLGDLEAPRLSLPIPQFGYLPDSSASGCEPNGTSFSRSAAPIPSYPQLEIPKPVKKLNEVTAWLQQIIPAENITSAQIFIFKISPTLSEVDLTILTDADFDVVCTLDPSAPSNATVIGYQQLLVDAAMWLDSNHIDKEQHRETRLKMKLLGNKVSREKHAIRRILKDEWAHQAKVAKLSYSFDSSRYYVDTFRLLPPIVLATYLMVATLHLICGLSMDHCSFVLGSLRFIVGLSMESATSIFTAHTKEAIHQDVRTVLEILDVDPRSKAYVSCPSCCRLYWIDPENPASYPDTCVNQETDQEVCGAKLKRNRKRRNGAVQLPVREFHYRSMHDYIARLYSRKDLQDYLYTKPIVRNNYDASDTWDVWDAPCLRNFRGPDGHSPFVDGRGKEGRLIFSLNMDGFNPFGNKEAGKKVSIGAIYMICLNLPPSLRYNIENVYLVGVIPGPREPSLHQINHFLKPLVDDLLTFWKTGVYISRTLRYPYGFLVRCAVVLLVCDLPAARQMSGFAHYRSHHFCSVCTQTLDDIQNINYEAWTNRDNVGHRNAAMQWRDAPTQKLREESVNTHGVRWSELLRLPYWDPTQFTVIDSMHAFYLRLFQHHCRSIWGMNIKFEDGAGLASESRNQPSEEEMKEANEIFRFGMKTSLKSLRVAILRQLCKETTTLNFHGRKAALIQRLLEYRVHQGWFSESGQRLGEEPEPAIESAPQQATESILINPDIQSYIKDGMLPPGLCIRTMQDVEDYYQNANNSTISKLAKPDLLTLFVHRVYPEIEITMEGVKRLIVAELRALIFQQRKADGIIDEKGRPKSRAATARKQCVLGRGVLAEIRHDMEQLSFPSWMTKAPCHPGEEKWGKFSADQWKTFCIHVLPVTLVRLWGHKSEESLERRQLENFMHLVSAVKLASMRTITEDVIKQYECHIHSYLHGLQLLYPDLKLTPYQHLSLHFGAFLRRFGPTHAWRCFPFERYNYVMQNLPTNRIFGELETTLFRKFCHAQNIRSFFTLDSIPSALLPLIDLFHKTFNKDTRGTRLSDVLFHEDKLDQDDAVTWSEAESTALPSDIVPLLRSWIQANDDLAYDIPVQRMAFQRSHIRRLGLRFTTASKSIDDSRVVIEHPRSGTEWQAGCVQKIFSHTRERADGSTVTQTFAVVSLYNHLSSEDRVLDCYQRYPTCGGWMFYDEFQQRNILVHVGQIKSHFAAYITKSPSGRGDFLLAQPLNK